MSGRESIVISDISDYTERETKCCNLFLEERTERITIELDVRVCRGLEKL